MDDQKDIYKNGQLQKKKSMLSNSVKNNLSQLK